MFFDVNDLKKVNDANGHEAGDRYLIGAKNIICGVFRNSPVFRVGGDEFVVILTGDDYVRRGELMDAVNASAAENLIEGRVAISGGIAEFDSRFDDDFSSVLRRADRMMYERKRDLKSKGGERD